jgi:sensory rhodopsin
MNLLKKIFIIYMISLKVNDYTGISFWIISIALGATTAFLLLEKQSVKEKWKLPLNISALVTGIAATHYIYMRKNWIINNKNITVFRYIDWILTVPLQIIEFYLILSVSKKIPKILFYKLLGASIIMLLFGFLGETLQINRTLGFTIGMIAWLYILYEIFFGQAAKLKNESKDPSVVFAFDALKWIVTLGWSIYPIGYLLNKTKLNIMYNLGDFINKILFGLIIWYAAKKKK